MILFNNNIGKNNKINRDAWLKKVLMQIPKGSRILDAGAGELQYKELCKDLIYVSQDFDQYNGIGNKTGLQAGIWDNTKVDIISDITSIPEGDQTFDAIMCIEVFEHIPEPQLAIKEFSRLLKQSGKLIITVPICSLTHFAPFYFYNGFSKFYFETYLNKYDFNIIEMIHNGNYFDYIAQEIRRIKKVARGYSKISIFDKIFLKIISWFFLFILLKFSTYDKGSNELLSFGLNIMAEKR